MVRTEETRRLWDAWSDDFQAAWNAATDEDGVPPAPVHVGPGCSDPLALFPDLNGCDAVEVGCGGGQGAIGLARRGADVVGVDLSTGQLRHARHHRAVHGIDDAVRLVAGDATALPLAADRFDLAYSSWVFQMVPDLRAGVAETARVLRPGGVFVLAVPHPVYRLFDEETGELRRSYFDATPERKSIGDLDPELTVFGRTVGEIHGALTDAGFVVERLLEPGHADPEDYGTQPTCDPDLMARVPPTLALRARLDAEDESGTAGR